MAFYQSDPEMLDHLKSLINRFSNEGRPELHKNISICWIRYLKLYPNAGSGHGATWSQNNLFYPASVVKLIYAIATEIWLQNDLLIESEELRRALSDMIIHSSNDATSYIVDILTGTNSGASLPEKEWEAWKQQRSLINQWLKTFNWSELENINCCQKTWSDGPYGREKDFYGENNENRNALSTGAVAKIFEALMTNSLISPKATGRLKNYLSRSLNMIDRKKNPDNQIDGFIGEGLSQKSKIWSKAGWMSEVRHDAAWWEEENKNPMLLVIFTRGTELSKDPFLLPAFADELRNFNS
ncbi:serine hydrolase [Prochlorococcus sp. MIT 1223]|uniref:serine hydrolase n=1 Tax=Prochlorococcus sp. MIT 1223 TaxID=3096217 RepID=UPI002A7480D1|nr:serine hydrolase [Prochlorococcus sp. MIT 1223]